LGEEGGYSLEAIVPVKHTKPGVLYNIVKALYQHPAIHDIHIPTDPYTDPDTTNEVLACHHKFRAHTYTGACGKGQNVRTSLGYIRSGRILLCDADYYGLEYRHLTEMTKPDSGMIVGVPTFPYNVPDHVINAWQYCSGFRALPLSLIEPLNLYGYLMETQINHAANDAGLCVAHVYMSGLISPFTWPLPKWRQEAMENDRKYGQEIGLLP
jgi:hypothetical protein